MNSETADEVKVKYECPTEDDYCEPPIPATMPTICVVNEVNKSEITFEDTKMTFHIVPMLPASEAPTTTKTTSKEAYACHLCSRVFKLRCRFRTHIANHKASSFECYQCSKTFQTVDTLKTHLQVVHARDNDKMFDCKLCDMKFVLPYRLKLHLLKHTGDERFQCTICSYKCQYESLLKTHMVIHSVDKPYGCDRCPSKFKRKEKLTRHMKTHSDAAFFCKQCPKKFKTEECLRCHMARHTSERRFGCDQCGKTFKTALCLRQHKQRHNENEYNCTECPKKYKSSNGLRMHREAHHLVAAVKRFECDKCGYKCWSGGVLKVHMRSHTGERPFPCTECSMAFSDQSRLAKHKRRHTPNPPNYKCSECPKKFMEKLSLQKHIRHIHIGEKPFECDVCAKKFTSKAGLNGHQFTHTEFTEFTCDICSHTSSDKSLLRRHMLVHVTRTTAPKKELKCELCDYKCRNSKEILTRHMRKHTMEAPFGCPQCPKMFKAKFHVYRHCRTVHRNKENEIDGIKKQSLIRLASTEPNFFCELCSEKVPTKFDLIQHMKLHSCTVALKKCPTQRILMQQTNVTSCSVLLTKI